MALTAPGADATVYVDSFMGNPTSATGATGGLFNQPRGVAVDDGTGDLFAVDAGNQRIQRFSSSGAFLRAWGRDVVSTGPGNADEQQRVTVAATGGTFTLAFTQTTAPIAWDASAATVQSELEALPAIGAGNVSVSGPAGGPWLVTFVGTLADANRAQMTASGSGLTGTAPSATVLTVADGGTTFEVCVPANGDVCKAGVSNAAGGAFAFGSGASARGGIAIDQATDNLYVTDANNLRIQQFTASGQFVRAWGRDVVVSGRANNVGTAALEVCDTTTTPANDLIDCKIGTSGSVGGAFATVFDGHPTVAPAGAPNAGNVIVADPGNRRVQEFGPSGQFVRAIGFDVIQLGGTGEVAGPLQNERQTVTLHGVFGPGVGLSGSFKLSFDGHETVAIAHDASPETVRAALEALPSVGPGNVAVSRSGLPWTVEFTGALGHTDVPTMTGNAAQLDDGVCGPGVCTFVAFETVQPGGPGPAFEVCTVAAECKAAIMGVGLGLPAGQFANEQPKSVAVDSTGAIYATEPTFAGGSFRMQKLTPQPGPTALAPSIFAPELLTAGGDGVSPAIVAVDPSTDRVFVVKGAPAGASTCPNGSPSAAFEQRLLELTPEGDLLDTSLVCAGFRQSGGGPILGLALRPSTGQAFVSSTHSGGSGAAHRVYVLDEDGITPAIASVNPATAVTDTTALLSGAVNPNSVDNIFAPTAWKIQYSRNGTDWQTAAQGSVAAAGTAPVAVSGTATGLLPNTTYRVRVLTQKPFANPEVASPELTLLTDAVAPDVAAVKADMVDQASARLTGQVNPHSTATSYRFEWGEDSFDRVTPVPDGPVGSGPDFRFVSQRLSGLEPATTYRFRLVATSQTEGATTSATKTFATTAASTDPLAREFELVSPADKVGGTGVGRWYAGPGSMAASGLAAWDGERFAVMGNFGSVLRDEGEFSFANDWAFADRVSDGAGWQSHSPVTHSSSRAQHTTFLDVAASSEDLSSVFWRSNSTPFFFDGFEEAWQEFDGGYLSDWGVPPAEPTRWERFGPGSLSQVDGPLAQDVKKLWDVKLSADGSTAVGMPGLGLGAPRLPVVHGVAGPGDPTARAFGDLVSGRSIYLADLAGGLTDTFAIGDRRLLNVCTGTLGTDRTALPAVSGSGDLSVLECPAPAAGRDARLVSRYGASFTSQSLIPPNGSFDGTVSEDGSRVFFLAPDPAATDVPDGTAVFCSGVGEGTLCPPQLFVRQRTPDGEVVRWISRAEDGLFGAQDASLTGAVRLEGSTPDGDKVFFRTSSPLTADDPNGSGAVVPGGVRTGSASSSSWDLYMYDLPDDPDADPDDGQLTRISAGPGGDGDCNSPQPSISAGLDNDTIGALRAVSDDGRRVYFTCTAPLPGVNAPADGTRLTAPGGTTSTTDQTNLYLYDANLAEAQRWRFVARLPRVLDVSGAGSVDACASAGTIPKSSFGAGDDDSNIHLSGWVTANCVNATSDGAFVTFMTNGRLTLDDAPAPATGDIYGYDADSDELVRITAAQGGVGGPQPCVTVSATPLCWGTGSPEWTPAIADNGRVNTALGVATDPLIGGDRVAFFQSLSRLVAEDVDEGYDVYQWRNGELSLVSTGKSDTDGALYKGNDRSGRNVYLVTQDRLSWQDTDAVADIYTARVGGGIDQPPPAAVCAVLVDGCHGLGADAVRAPDSETRSLGPVGNAVSGVRKQLIVGGISRKALRRAARSGVLPVSVRTSEAGEVSAVARGRVGKRSQRVARASVLVGEAGKVTLKLRLNRAARQRLGGGKALRLSIEVTSPGARSRTKSVRLPGVSS